MPYKTGVSECVVTCTDSKGGPTSNEDSKVKGQVQGKGPNQMSKGPNELSKGPHQISKGPQEMSKGPHQMSKGPHQMSGKTSSVVKSSPRKTMAKNEITKQTTLQTNRAAKPSRYNSHKLDKTDKIHEKSSKSTVQNFEKLKHETTERKTQEKVVGVNRNSTNNMKQPLGEGN